MQVINASAHHDNMKVLVLGAAGQLGAAVVHEFGPHAEVVAYGRGDLDITDDVAWRCAWPPKRLT